MSNLPRLEIELRDTGIVYNCPTGQHDDLGISCAMLAWAARHPHLELLDREICSDRRGRASRGSVQTGLACTCHAFVVTTDANVSVRAVSRRLLSSARFTHGAVTRR